MKKAAIMASEPQTQLVVQTALECAGYTTIVHDTVLSLLRGVKRDDVSLVVLDADAVGGDWPTVLNWRISWLNADVVTLLVGADDPAQAATALDAGADDYLAKPIRGREFIARVAAAHRRRHPADRAVELTMAGCTLHPERRELRSARCAVVLTTRELALAEILFRESGRIVTRQRIAAEVWELSEELSSRTIEQHIYQLRRKLARCAGSTLELKSVYGSGYVLNDLSSVARPASEEFIVVKPSPKSSLLDRRVLVGGAGFGSPLSRVGMRQR